MELLVEPETLHTALGRPALRIIDATWYLPSEGRDPRAEYEESHLPGAVWLDLSTDLADPDAPVRNTVADPEALGRAFSKAGISEDHEVVVYDHRGGYSAGRVWWTLRYAGHRRAALLRGGFERWRREDRPVTAAVPQPALVRFEPRIDSRWLVHKADLEAILAEGSACVVDARSEERFLGRGAEPARRKGHMPGARNVPWSRNIDPDTHDLLSRDRLREIYEEAGVPFDRPVVTTCGSGVTASLAAFALTWLGHPEVAVYDGSWAEWGNASDVPVVGE